jgi:viologen exporter family transport system permease protein
MSPHWHLFKVGLQNSAAYRTNFLFRALFNLFPLIAALALWRAIFAGGHQTVGGYTLAEMLSYYLIATLIDMTTTVTEDEWQIAGDIRDGTIAQFLIRPIEYFRYRLCLFAANRVTYTIVASLPITAIILCNHRYLLAPDDVFDAVAFLVSLVFAALLQFLLAYVTALLAFWILEISTFSFMLLAAQRIAGGEMFPLDLLPAWLGHLIMATPFPYCMFFPASVYMGRTTLSGVAQGLAIQVFWIVALFALTRFVWSRGLRTFTLVGG